MYNKLQSTVFFSESNNYTKMRQNMINKIEHDTYIQERNKEILREAYESKMEYTDDSQDDESFIEISASVIEDDWFMA